MQRFDAGGVCRDLSRMAAITWLGSAARWAAAATRMPARGLLRRLKGEPMLPPKVRQARTLEGKGKRL